MAQKCFLCAVELNENTNSKEHIIKNSIGGKKQVKGFICKTCNNTTGNKWDNEIDKDFGENLSVMFDIKRDRGKVQDLKVKDKLSNKHFLINTNKFEQIEPEYTYDKDNGKILITAPNAKRGFNFKTYFLNVIMIIFENAIYQLKNNKEENKVIYINLYKSQKLIILEIEDTGGGIENKNLDKIFDLDFTTKKENGSGIGLALAKKLVKKRLNGEIKAENGDFGAKFIIHLFNK